MSVTSGNNAGHHPVTKVNPARFVKTEVPAGLNPEVLRFCLGFHESCCLKKMLESQGFFLTKGSVTMDSGIVSVHT